MIGRKAKLGRAAAYDLTAKLLVHDVLLAMLFGSSLAEMSEASAAHVKADARERLKIVAAGGSDPAMRAAVENSGLYLMALIEASETDIRKRVSAASIATIQSR